ncbi:hypothetical protein [Cronobacter malonaticus]|uniref:hypothetical protein n=1 Tax=Cronobacter malonaticus TaxID=413503 RepID=UPI000CFDDDA2|nr:hypothetical protein [Cronobacter malonaticus]
MSTISNDVLEKLSVRYRLLAKIHDGSESQAWEESALIVEELLALRKERERAEPVAYIIQDKYHREKGDEGYLSRVHASRYIPGDDIFKDGVVCTPLFKEAPPAPSIADDSLPYDPQIAEYEQMMEAEQAQADNTAQQFESLAGKSVGEDASSMADAHMAWLNTNFPRNAYSDEEWEEISLYTWLAWRDSQRNACFPGT